MTPLIITGDTAVLNRATVNHDRYALLYPAPSPILLFVHADMKRLTI
jgi:hypothetical protein